MLYAGLDYRLSENTLVGVLGQYDRASETNNQENYDIDGDGWLVGPYLVSRLTDNLIFDGRVAWGQSNNDISPFQTYTDEFTTNRWLLKGQFTGDFKLDNWDISPSVSVIYFEDEQQSYTDSLNILIPEQTVSLGRVVFGPRLSRTYVHDKRISITPNFNFRGIWDFEEAQIVNLDTGSFLNSDGLRGRFESGLLFSFPSGTRLGFDGFYDGIGAANFESYGLKLNVNFELQ